MAKFKIVVTPGDGIGPEVIAEAVKVLKAIGCKYGHTFDLRNELIGGVAIDAKAHYVGTFFDLLNPYALLGGVALVALCAFYGAIFLSLIYFVPISR